MKNIKIVKITKEEEWKLLSSNKFKRTYASIKEETNREEFFQSVVFKFDFDKFYNESKDDVIFTKNRSADYIDNGGCHYSKKGQAYMFENDETVVIFKDYGHTISFRVIEK